MVPIAICDLEATPDARQNRQRESVHAQHLATQDSNNITTMALPLLPGLTPPEVAFLCEMELVTVIPRQRLESLQLLGVS